MKRFDEFKDVHPRDELAFELFKMLIQRTLANYAKGDIEVVRGLEMDKNKLAQLSYDLADAFIAIN